VVSRRCDVGLASGDSRIGGRRVGGADRQRERVERRRIDRGVLRGRDRFGGRAGETFVEVQRDAPMLGRRTQRVGEVRSPIVVEQRGRQPRGLIGLENLPGLAEIAGPENIVRRRDRRRSRGQARSGGQADPKNGAPAWPRFAALRS
jgi:hypothetical protein